MLWLAVAIGGALGAMSRYGVALLFSAPTGKFPLATLTVNVLGSLIIGVFYILIIDKGVLAPHWRHIVMVGFLGAFTTFSTFSIETLQLVQAGHWQTALAYFSSSFILCILAVYLGISMTEKLI